MLYNTFEFAVFFAIVLVTYWVVLRRWVRAQNIFLLAMSYVFYGWWDYRFLSLVVLSSIVDWASGWMIGREKSIFKRRLYFLLSLGVNLGCLGFFKYYNFFAESLAASLASIGVQTNFATLQVILPVGISFYTFQTLTYTIDIYRGELKPIRDPIAFAAYVSFFPQLVAGPIERAADLLPQFIKERRVTRAEIQDGARQVLWGLFKKMVIADNLALQVDDIFANYAQLDGVTLWIGAFFFAIQIYCDFSGYTDIGLGTARLLGFDLKKNFDYPYFSRNIAEFWRRWHISLSNWFRDYLYIPLGGSRRGGTRTLFNLLLTFTLCGLWHGASWTFVVWGCFNGLLFVPLILTNRHKVDERCVAHDSVLPSLREAWAMFATFNLVLCGWVFFRAVDMPSALGYFAQFAKAPYLGLDYSRYAFGLWLSVGLLLVEWVQRRSEHGLQIARVPLVARYAIYFGLLLIMVEFSSREHVPFIYFQF
jgi:D-alanyl-lipoteichoic acid acyltransferase DltB (MBOAT superfamily)